METTATRETLGFQAEVKQLLHLLIHSVYGNKEIFLRELVSNASDAGDKLRFEAITDAALFEDAHDLNIRVGYDPAARTITISDNGIGLDDSVAAFEPFVTTKPEGMGLGLAICRSIVAAHEGTLSAERNVGFGTTFTVTLPVQPVASQ